MKASPNYIHFRVHWQVLGPESPGQRFKRADFQKFFETLNAARTFSGYDDFVYRPDLCELAKARGAAPQGGQAFSKVAYANDTLSVVEEWTDHSTDEYAQKMKIVLDCWFDCFPQTLAVVQTCCLRALVNPAHFEDSRAFLGDKVLGLGQSFKSKLQEMPHKVGLTFACRRRAGSADLNFEAKASSWRDTPSIWVEVVGVTPMVEPLNAAKHDQAEVVFGRCRAFLEQEVLPLLAAYDVPGDGKEGEVIE